METRIRWDYAFNFGLRQIERETGDRNWTEYPAVPWQASPNVAGNYNISYERLYVNC